MPHDFKNIIIGAAITAVTFFGIKELVNHVRNRDDFEGDDDFIIEDDD